MQNLYILRGLSGSGKSTLAETMLAKQSSEGIRSVIVEADQFFTVTTPHKTEYSFDRRFLGAAHDLCYGRAMNYLRQGKDVIVANTFSSKREVDRYVSGVKRCGLRDVRVTVVKCVGEYPSQHKVPERIINSMRSRWEDYPGEFIYNGKE